MNSLALVLAQTSAPVLPEHTLGGSLLNIAVYVLVGVLLAIAGYKLFDLCTPGDLHQEIVKNRNLAAALVGAAIIIGVCIIVAAAIVG